MRKKNISPENKELREEEEISRQLRKRVAELEGKEEMLSRELVRRDKIIEKLRLHDQGLRGALKMLPKLSEMKHSAKAFVSKIRLPQLVTNLTRHGPSKLTVNQDQAAALVLELCRFLVLKSIVQDYDGTKLMASPAVDAAWYVICCIYMSSQMICLCVLMHLFLSSVVQTGASLCNCQCCIFNSATSCVVGRYWTVKKFPLGETTKITLLHHPLLLLPLPLPLSLLRLLPRFYIPSFYMV